MHSLWPIYTDGDEKALRAPSDWRRFIVYYRFIVETLTFQLDLSDLCFIIQYRQKWFRKYRQIWGAVV